MLSANKLVATSPDPVNKFIDLIDKKPGAVYALIDHLPRNRTLAEMRSGPVQNDSREPGLTALDFQLAQWDGNRAAKILERFDQVTAANDGGPSCESWQANKLQMAATQVQLPSPYSNLVEAYADLVENMSPARSIWKASVARLIGTPGITTDWVKETLEKTAEKLNKPFEEVFREFERAQSFLATDNATPPAYLEDVPPPVCEQDYEPTDAPYAGEQQGNVTPNEPLPFADLKDAEKTIRDAKDCRGRGKVAEVIGYRLGLSDIDDANQVKLSKRIATKAGCNPETVIAEMERGRKARGDAPVSVQQAEAAPAVAPPLTSDMPNFWQEPCSFAYGKPNAVTSTFAEWPAKGKTRADVRSSLTNYRAHEGKEDAPAFIAGTLTPEDQKRKDENMAIVYMMVGDFDNGTTKQQVLDAYAAKGLYVQILPSFNDGKSYTDVQRKAVIDWMKENGKKGEPTVEDVVAYIREKKGTMEYVLEGVAIETKGTNLKTLRLRHQPCPRFRTVAYLETPFVVANRWNAVEERRATDKEAAAEWAKRWAEHFKALGLSPDPACSNISHLYYYASFPEGTLKPQCPHVEGRAVTEADMPLPAVTPSTEKVDTNTTASTTATAAKVKPGDKYPDQPPRKVTNLDQFFKSYPEFKGREWCGEKGLLIDEKNHVTCPFESEHTEKNLNCCFVSQPGDEKNPGAAICQCQHSCKAKYSNRTMWDGVFAMAGVTDAMDIAKEYPELCGKLLNDKTAEEEEVTLLAVPYLSLSSLESDLERLADITRMTKAFYDFRHWIMMRYATKAPAGEFSIQGMMSEEELTRRLATITKEDVSTVKKDLDFYIAVGYDKKGVNLITQTLLEFNEEFALINTGSKIKFMANSTVPGKQPAMHDGDAFSLRTRPRVIKQKRGEAKKNVPEEKTPVSLLWTSWSMRREYMEGIVFEPPGSKALPALRYGEFNTWNGFPVTGKPGGSWALLRGHVKDNLCQGDKLLFNLVMTFMADIFQNPGNKPGCALVIKGKRGTGKSKFIDWVRVVLGNLGVKIASSKRKNQQFNMLTKNKLLIHEEEAANPNSKDAESQEKDDITSTQTIAEAKFGDAYETSNHARYIKISNESHIIPASTDEDERRYLVLLCGSSRITQMPDGKPNQANIDFFIAIDEEMSNGGDEAMVHEFMTWDPKTVGLTWNSLRTPPRTEGLKEQIRQNLELHEQFFIDLVREGELTAEFWTRDEEGHNVRTEARIVLKDGDKGTRVSVTDLREAFVQYMKKHNAGTSLPKQGKFDGFTVAAKKFLQATKSDTNPNVGFREGKKCECFVMPALSDLRKAHVEAGWTEGVGKGDDPKDPELVRDMALKAAIEGMRGASA